MRKTSRVVYTEADLDKVVRSIRAIFNKYSCEGVCRDRTETRCCYGRKRNRGYFGKTCWEYGKYNLPEEYKKFWNRRNGFWTTNGCSLPDNMKSATCIG